MPAGSLDPLFAPLLQLATAIADNPASRPHAPQLRQAIDGIISSSSYASAAAQIPEPDFRDGLYAVVAFLDELLQSYYSPVDWSPASLTLHYFEDNNAGLNYFSRLERLVNEQRWDVVRIYYLTLGLGFLGKYALTGDNAGPLAHRRRLATMLGIHTGIAPLVSAESRLPPQRPAWYAWAPLGLAGASLIALAVVLAIG